MKLNDSIIFKYIDAEEKRQREGIELIASENFVSSGVLRAAGSVLTNKYVEGYPKKRYYGGCEVVDEIENLAIERAKKLFGVDYANVQPHSGSQANMSVYLSVLKPGDTFLGFDLAHGGHLTHGASVNFSGTLYKCVSYGVDKETHRIDYEQVRTLALKEKPKLIVCGASSYTRDIDYAKFRAIADEIGALLWADIAHPSGLIASKLLNNPTKDCHIITTTTHKTLRGPRGGMVLLPKDFQNNWGVKTPKGEPKTMAQLINSSVFPGIQGGALEHIIAAKAIAFFEAQQESFKEYSKQVIKNAKKLSSALQEKGYEIVSGGTDNHCILIDLHNLNINGKQATKTLEQAGITCNKNMIPFDDKSPFLTSGIRLGTAAITTRGLKEDDMLDIANYIDEALKNKDNSNKLTLIKEQVCHFIKDYPLFNEQ